MMAPKCNGTTVTYRVEEIDTKRCVQKSCLSERVLISLVAIWLASVKALARLFREERERERR